MGKVNLYIKYCLRNEKIEYNIKGILQDNKLKYKDNDSTMIIDLKNKTLNRIKDNQEYLFDFINSKCYINYNNTSILLPINVIKYEFNNNIFVKYQIENDNFEIKIQIMEEKWKS